MDLGTLSDLMGWASIGCWLGAQFPQVLENVRRQSCDGLALPFLLNWLLGDITNLVGCLLTHQLPFQTILATYFVSVDFMLFSQYFYYSRSRSPAQTTLGSPALLDVPRSPLYPPLPEVQAQRYSSRTRAFSAEREHRYRTLSNAAAGVAIAAALAASEEELHGHTHGHTHVPRRASLKSASAHARRETTEADAQTDMELGMEIDAEAEDEVDEDALAALADSFHSESGRKRVSWSRERYAAPAAGRGGSSSRTRPTLSPLTTMRASVGTGPGTVGSESDAQMQAEMDAAAVAAGRGRPRQRQVVESPLDEEGLGLDLDPYSDLEQARGRGHGHGAEGSVATVRGHEHGRERERERRSSRASHRSVGLVFLGVWALVGVGAFSGFGSESGSGAGAGAARVVRTRTRTEPRGVVLSEVGGVGGDRDESGGWDEVPDLIRLPLHAPSHDGDGDTAEFKSESQFEFELLSSPASALLSSTSTLASASDEPSSERVIGRIFAWLCTTLYLTSRLPQIWKNFMRKSVEGLSMYLFVFAFLGNTFYVLSILTSPKMVQPQPAATAFLLESIPYLLGSGGTLLFDVTIVMQSFLYRAKPGRGRGRAQSYSHSRSRTRTRTGSASALGTSYVKQHARRYGSVEEEQGLLSTDFDPECEVGTAMGGEGGSEWAQYQYQHARRRKDSTGPAPAPAPCPGSGDVLEDCDRGCAGT
ncbi:hypothetical protein M0805_000640 [Coniferiporia weirii]|nr:hypothetical protein M0805_000640 [Coniferiporia weirii]